MLIIKVTIQFQDIELRRTYTVSGSCYQGLLEMVYRLEKVSKWAQINQLHD